MSARSASRLLRLLIITILSLAIPYGPLRAGDAEVLAPGPAREHPIAAGESHVYRAVVGDAPLLVTVEQMGIDLVVEVQGPAGGGLKAAGDGRWCRQVLLLEGGGEHRIEIHPKEQSGRYSIQMESLTGTPPERRQALALMSRAGQEIFMATPEAWRRAMATYREAMTLWQALGDRRWEAEALAGAAVLDLELSDLRTAQEDNAHVLDLWRALAEPRREAATLNLLGLARLYSGESAGAREALAESASLWQRLGERFEAANTRGNLCFLEQKVGSLRTALSCYGEPRAVFRELGDRAGESRMLNNLGGIHDLLGEPDEALEQYRQALDLRRALGDRLGEAQDLNNIAVVHRNLGEWQEALRLYGEEREILARIGDRSLQAALFANIGTAYTSLGEPGRALTSLEGALKLYREIGDRPSEVSVLNHLGTARRKLGDLRKALGDHEQARELAVALRDARLEAVSRLRLGEVRLEQGDASAALREIAPALPSLKAAGLRQIELQALQLQGRALAFAGRPQEAIPVLEEALAGRRALRDAAGETESLSALAETERSLGRTERAREHAEAAIARVEELRTGLASPDLRASFLATRRRVYSLLIDLLMDRHAAEPKAGWDRAAFALSERARARSLLDGLFAGRAGSAVSGDLIEQRRALRRRLGAKADQHLRQNGAQAEALAGEIEALRAELDRVEGEIRHQNPQDAAFSQPQPVGPDELSKLLGPRTLLLEYALGEGRSFLWVAGAGRLRSFILPAQGEIETLARQAYQELSTVEAGAGQRGQSVAALSRILLAPVWKEAAKAGRLVIVPDGGLHYLPFAALPVPGPRREPLLEHAEVDYLPSATTLALQRRRLSGRAPAPKWAAVLADPVFAADDPRLAGPFAGGTAAKEAFARLSGSGQEAEAIRRLAPPGEVWTALGLAASRETVLSGQLHAYRVIHFATHGVADSHNPELSGLVLSLVDAAGHSREGFVSLSDIYDLDLAADLVVLSGCRTAFGKEVRGEGLMGLTRGFLYAGVPRVIASLWPVQDRAGTRLMTQLYTAMRHGGLTPAAALRKAQLALRRDGRYRAPFSWAGFVLQGDWR